MAEPTQTSSTFPNPPDFLWRQFTPDKTARFEEAKKAWETAHPEAASVQTVLRIPDLPDDLQHLQPPPEPADGTWRSLGGVWTLHDVLPNIEEWGMQRLEPAKANGAPPATLSADDTNRDRALNLKRLAKSALLNFLEFVGVASIDPDGISEKTDDIETILINMHHGINEYRPHQARESLIQTMQNRLDQIRAETAAVNAVTDKGKRVLEGLGSIGVPTEKEGTALGKDDGRDASLIDDADDVWADAAAWA